MICGNLRPRLISYLLHGFFSGILWMTKLARAVARFVAHTKEVSVCQYFSFSY